MRRNDTNQTSQLYTAYPHVLSILLSLCLAPTTAWAAGKIYWTQRDGPVAIKRANLDGSDLELIAEGDNLAGSIAFDPVGEKIYWTNPGALKIQRANLDGSNIEDIVTGVLAGDIALDLLNEKVYWNTTDSIQRANLDGSGVETPLPGLGALSSFALDVANNRVYVTEIIGLPVDKIFRVDLDGSNNVDLVTGLIQPSSIALDLAAGKIYWTDTDNFFCCRSLRRSNLDGSSSEFILSGGVPALMDFALDTARGKVYWLDSDGGTDFLRRANLDGSFVEDIFTTLPENSFRTMFLDLLSALEFRVSDSSNGDPILDAEVHVERQDVPTGFDADFVRIDSNGEAVYAVDFLEPGSYRVTANAPGFLVSTPFVIALGQTEILSTNIQLDPDPTFDESNSVELTILSAGAGDTLLTNALTVTDNGTMLPVASLETVFKDGSMLLLGLPEGSFDITATDSAFSFTTATVSLGTAERDTLSISGSNNVTPGTIRGDVLDSNFASAPLGGAKVFADSSNSDVVVEVESSTDPLVLGEYAATDVVPGNVTVTALTADGKTTSVPIEGIVVALTSGGLVSNVDLDIPVPDDDSDGDGLPDLWEIEHNLDPNDPSGDNGRDGDPDGDGLTNEQELDEGTIPTNTPGQTDGFDTDGDGFSDGFEVAHNSSPLDGERPRCWIPQTPYGSPSTSRDPSSRAPASNPLSCSPMLSG